MSTRAKWPEIRDLSSNARRKWETRSRCKKADPADFDLQEFEGGIPQRARDAAERYCRHCPVLADCGAAAFAARSTGLRGAYWGSIQDKAPRYVRTPLIPVESLLKARSS